MCVYKHKTFSIANVSIYFINSEKKEHLNRLSEMDKLFYSTHEESMEMAP